MVNRDGTCDASLKEANWIELRGQEKILDLYRKSSRIIHKLKKLKSVTVIDDIFLKADIAMVIGPPKLQLEVKKFLKHSHPIYAQRFETRYVYFQKQTMCEGMKSKPGSSYSIVIVQRGEINENLDKEKVTTTWKSVLFPAKTGIFF